MDPENKAKELVDPPTQKKKIILDVDPKKISEGVGGPENSLILDINLQNSQRSRKIKEYSISRVRQREN